MVSLLAVSGDPGVSGEIGGADVTKAGLVTSASAISSGTDAVGLASPGAEVGVARSLAAAAFGKLWYYNVNAVPHSNLNTRKDTLCFCRYQGTTSSCDTSFCDRHCSWLGKVCTLAGSLAIGECPVAGCQLCGCTRQFHVQYLHFGVKSVWARTKGDDPVHPFCAGEQCLRARPGSVRGFNGETAD